MQRSLLPARLALAQSITGLVLALLMACHLISDSSTLLGDDDGMFGCMSLLGCQDICPKALPLQTRIAFIRHKMVTVS